LRTLIPGSRSALSLVSLATAIALGSAGCKASTITTSQGTPKAALGGISGAGTVMATFPNPCEIDVDFGNVPIGLSDSATIQVDNTGSAALDLSQVNPTLDPEF